MKLAEKVEELEGTDVVSPCSVFRDGAASRLWTMKGKVGTLFLLENEETGECQQIGFTEAQIIMRGIG